MFLGVSSDGGNGHDMVSNTIAANGSKKVLFRPLTSAVLNMSKYLPALLLSQGMTIELELDEAANSMASAVGATTHSQAFELEDCRCLCVVCMATGRHSLTLLAVFHNNDESDGRTSVLQ